MAWPGEVPVGPLQEAFLRSGLTAYEVAKRAGFMCPCHKSKSGGLRPDNTRLKRRLGLALETNGKYVQAMRYETALKLAEAIGVDPVDVGC